MITSESPSRIVEEKPISETKLKVLTAASASTSALELGRVNIWDKETVACPLRRVGN